MRQQSSWSPRLAEITAPASDRLAIALAGDILAGRVTSGTRLPAHRDLAFRLGLGLGTVTKAYGVLEKRGLTRSVKGRGTFVASLELDPSAKVDLSVNTPPRVLGEKLLARTLTAVAKRVEADLLTTYPSDAGRMEHRRLMARWLGRSGMGADPAQVLLCNGAQQGLAIAFSASCPRGGTVITEAVTYPGALLLARRMGYRVAGVAMDAEGVRPDALEHALAAEAANSPVVYLTPTRQNPTTATMSYARRVAIAEICRSRRISIIEDDVYASEAGPAQVPLAMLAPERVYYINSLSKTLSPGLRIGALIPPIEKVEECAAALSITSQSAAPLACLVMEQWLTDGTAEATAAAMREEAMRRTELALSLIRVHSMSDTSGFHLWLPMPRSEAESIVGAAAAIGIHLTPPASLMADPGESESGIRLCLGGPTFRELTRALTKLADLLRAGSRSAALAGPSLAALR